MPSLKIVQYVRKYAEFFVDLWLQEYEFQRYDSHTMAWAIVLASRRAVHFRKVWNEEFEFLLNWNLQDVEECYREIYKFYISSFPDKGGWKKDLGKEDYSKHKTSHHESSTNRQASSTLKQRSNSIKSHLWSIETKNVHYSKPRNNTKRNDSIQKRDNSSIPRISTNTEILKWLKDNSLNWNVTTPDKWMINANKNSSSNKKSSIKRFKPNILHQSRIPKPIMYDSNQRKPKIQSRNPKIDWRKTTKLDFDLSNLGMKVDNTSKSRKSLIPCNTSYQHISHNSSGMDTSYNKENTINQSTQNLRPNLKLKISKSKIYTTMDAKPELSRNKSFLKSNSKGSSTHNINESLTNYRSSSNLRPAMSRPNIIHNSSIKYSWTGLGIHTGVPSHNKSYGKIHINTIRQ